MPIFKSKRCCFYFLTLLLLTFAAFPLLAEVDPPKAETEAGRLIYSVNRAPEPLLEAPRAVQVVTADDIWRRGARTLPEVLMEEAGIMVQQTNYGSGSPYLRGLVGKQILILIDGVRINTATYRFGPLQYLNTIDLAAVERIEIVRGIGTIWGSDALGGVINVITKKGPGPGENVPFGGTVNARYSTADDGIVGHAEVAGRNDRWRYLAGVTLRDFGDVEGGGDVGEQVPTGYEEQAANIYLERFLGGSRSLSLAYLLLDESDVPRTDRVRNGSNLVFDFDPQRLSLLRLSYLDTSDVGWRDSLQITAFVNAQREGRREIRANAPQTALRFLDQQEVLGFNLELGSASSRHAFVYGLDFTSEDITSRRTDVNLLTGATRERRGNFIDSAGYQLLGVYVQDRWKISDRWGSTLGLRYSRYSADGTEATALGVLDLAGDDSSLTASAGVDFAPTRNLKLLANATQGLRAPNLEDLSIINERPDGTEIGNPQLSSEAALMLEAGFKYFGKRLELTGFAYRTELDDLFERSAGTFEGLPFFDLDGDGVQDPGEPNVLQRQNIGEATIDGLELEWTVHLRPEWRVYGNYTSTRGTDTRTDEPLRRIPPDFGLLGLRWAPAGHPRRAWAELVLQSAAAQRRLNREDVTDDRIGPGGTDGFNVFHLRGGLRFGERFRATLALENLGDERYKIHGSGIYRPGFQAVVQGELSF